MKLKNAILVASLLGNAHAVTARAANILPPADGSSVARSSIVAGSPNPMTGAGSILASPAGHFYWLSRL